MFKSLIYVGAVAGALGLAACEEAGEKADSAIEEVTQGHENKGDGALEKAGEAVDNAVGAERKGDAADSLGDAVDGDPKTKPN